MDALFGFVIIFAIGAGLFVLMRWYFAKDAVARRALQAQQRVDIGAVADGATVKIAGRVSYVGRKQLEAPLSGRPCACWEVVVEESVSSGDSTHWQEIIRDQASQPFLLDDGTGRALVEARHPSISLTKDDHFRSGTFNDAAPALEAFLERYGTSSTGLLGLNKTMRYHEGAIEAGETVSAFGRARLEPDPEGATAGGYRQAPMRVVLGEPEEGDMLLSDDESTAA